MLHLAVEIVAGSLVTGYWIWVGTEWRQLRSHGKEFIKELVYCSKKQVRHWCGKYTKLELENWQDKSRKEYPGGVKPSVPWHEAKYHFSCFVGQFQGPYFDLKRFFCNCVYYAPFLWRDAWWDHTYLLYIIERKCSRDAEAYKTKGHLANNETTATEVREVADLCGRLRNAFENYEEPLYKLHDAKWGEASMDWQPTEYIDPEDPDPGGMMELHITRPNALNPKDKEKEREEFRAIGKVINKAIQKDTHRLGFLMMRVRNWWD